MTAEIGIIKETPLPLGPCPITPATTPLQPRLFQRRLNQVQGGQGKNLEELTSQLRLIKAAKFFGSCLSRPVIPKRADATDAAGGTYQRPLPNQVLVDWAKHMPREKGGFIVSKVATKPLLQAEALNLPRLPSSALAHLRKELEAEMLSKCPDYPKDKVAWAVERRRIIQEAGEKWKNLSDEDKKKYQDQAEADAARYAAEKEAWMAAHPGQNMPVSTKRLARALKKRKEAAQHQEAAGPAGSKRKRSGVKRLSPRKKRSPEKAPRQETEELLPEESDASDSDAESNMSESGSEESDMASDVDSLHGGDELLEEEDAAVAAPQATAPRPTRPTRASTRLAQQTPPNAPQQPVFARPNPGSKSNRPVTPHKRRQRTAQSTPLESVPFEALADAASQEFTQRISPAEPVIMDGLLPHMDTDGCHETLEAGSLATLAAAAGVCQQHDEATQVVPPTEATPPAPQSTVGATEHPDATAADGSEPAGTAAHPAATRTATGKIAASHAVTTRAQQGVLGTRSSTRTRGQQVPGVSAPVAPSQATQEVFIRPTRSRAASQTAATGSEATTQAAAATQGPASQLTSPGRRTRSGLSRANGKSVAAAPIVASEATQELSQRPVLAPIDSGRSIPVARNQVMDLRDLDNAFRDAVPAAGATRLKAKK